MADTTRKIIRGVVNSRGFTITSAITQWDYGWQFIPEIEDLPATYRLDFSNEEKHGTALPVYCSTEGAEVPTELIDTGKDVWVWFVRIGDGYGITEYKWRIPNKCKSRVESEEPTPSQQSSIDQLIVRSNEAVETAEEKAEEAGESAQEAAESARASGESALSASNSALSSGEYASNALGYAESASASATASAQSASDAETARQAATSLVAEAQRYANASEQSAQASATSASQAHGFAQSASASAQSASGYASQAQTSAQTASSKAQDASTSAQTASTKATEASQSASQALTYKTDAESAKTASQTAQGLAEQARDTAVQAKTDAESARDEAQNLVDGISGKVEQIDSNTERIESLEDDRYKAFVTDSASGSIASFPDGADGIPLKSLVVDINPVQDLSNGDPSPENICPISGWTGMQLKAMGKNLLDPSLLKDQVGWNIIPFYAPVGTVLTMSTNQPGASTSGLLTYFRTPGGAQGSNELVLSTHPVTKTVGEEGYLEIVQRNRDNIKSYADYEYQIELGYTATAYEPHVGQTIPISWQTEAGTVYGGKLDVLSGKLYVGYGICKVKDLSWSMYNTAFYATKSDILHGVTRVDVRCDRYRTANSASGVGSAGGWPDKIILGNVSTSSVVYVKDTAYASASEFKTAQGEMDIVYPLETPIEIQLTPHEINSLLGQNNIFADTGDTEVEYRADTKLYIKRLTDSDTDMIADANITSGQYFMVGNDLYKATVNIASGAQVIAGTNATKVSLSEALNQIKEA